MTGNRAMRHSAALCAQAIHHASAAATYDDSVRRIEDAASLCLLTAAAAPCCVARIAFHDLAWRALRLLRENKTIPLVRGINVLATDAFAFADGADLFAERGP
jgi:hypothetical protein